ncbi:MAG TPA: hypothetical protein VK195_16350 [Burkholderiaceae bacterium]|nr:hypothetical protein [Burkholderiaceae bacterium]
MNSRHETGTAPQAGAADEGRTEAQRQLDHLFRHALKDERVSPLYFLMQRYRNQGGKSGAP